MKNRDSTERSEQVAITGLGMVSSLGHDVFTGCAAARAGIVRSTQLECFPVMSPDGDVGGVIGHTVPIITEGFEGSARLLRMAHASLADLRTQTPNIPWGDNTNVGFYISLPDPNREHSGLDLVLFDDAKHQRKEQASQVLPNASIQRKAIRLIKNAAQMTGWEGEPNLRYLTTSGHDGTANALAKAAEELKQGTIQFAILLALDSLVGEETLCWLNDTGRLKTAEVPVGLQPGEASVSIVLELHADALLRKSLILGILASVNIGREQNIFLSNKPKTGKGLAKLLANLANSIETIGQNHSAWIISDQNGENSRALEWGYALPQVISCSIIYADPIIWLPAASFGDTGAASGAIAVCMACCAFNRGYAPSDVAVILSSSDGNGRSAVMIARYTKENR